MKNVRENYSLKAHNSFGIDVHAQYFAEFSSVEELRAIFDNIYARNFKWIILSGGNNVLFTYHFEGVVIHPVARGIESLGVADGIEKVRVEAGVEWDDFVEWCVVRGMGGVENLSLIPGYVGAAPVQNIGAYGVEAESVITEVEVYDIASHKVKILTHDECLFGYRDSIFKHRLNKQEVITAVTFALKHEPEFKLSYGDLAVNVEARGGATLRNIRDAVIEIRQAKLPDPKVLGNAGSFFKNPVVSVAQAERLKAQFPDMPLYNVDNGAKLAAGWLIDRSGWKGRRVGNVGMHDKQALVLVNYGGATGRDIINFARMVQDDVKAKFAVEIEAEVNIV